MGISIFLTFLAASCSTVQRGNAEGQPDLATILKFYGAQINSLENFTASGYSSGGTMAQHLQVAHSACFNCSTAFASVPYYCGKGGYTKYRATCSFGLRTLEAMVKDARQYEAEGKIDSLKNLENQKHCHYVGTLDLLANYNPKIRWNTARFFQEVGMKFNNTKLYNRTGADHFFPTTSPNKYECTDHFKFLLDVVVSGEDISGVAHCDLNGAYYALKCCLGQYLQTCPLHSDVIPIQPLIPFDQSQYIDVKSMMDPTGYLYIPSGCRNNTRVCSFHTVLHGCRGCRSAVKTAFIDESGYKEVAELNNIILMFPQSVKIKDLNPDCCWDVFDADAAQPDAATKFGIQLSALIRMIRKATGKYDC